MKLVPFTVNVIPTDPAPTAAGVTDDTIGLTTGGVVVVVVLVVEPPPPPEQPVRENNRADRSEEAPSNTI